MHRVLTVFACLVLAACSSGRRAAPVQQAVPYGPTTQTAPTYRAAPTYRGAPGAQPATRPMPAPTTRGASGPFRWHPSLAEAQATARREGKLLLVGSTKPGCSLCEKFKTQIVPSAGSAVSSQAVGFMVEANNLQAQGPGAQQLWSTLRSRLATAGLMPLVGVFTPDLQYLSGFGGPPDQGKLMSALAEARSRYRGAAAPVRAIEAPPYRTAQLNEFGEYEWTPTGTLWPQDALKPDVAPAATPEPVVAALPEPASTPAPAAARAPAPAPATPPVAVAPPEPTAAAAPPSPAVYGGPDGQALAALDEALGQIRAGDLEAAKATLARVKQGNAGTAIGREAAKGEIAVWNLQRMEDATSGTERTRLRMKARDNLRGSMWMVLFS